MASSHVQACASFSRRCQLARAYGTRIHAIFRGTQKGTPLVLLGSVGITKALSGTGLKMEQF